MGNILRGEDERQYPLGVIVSRSTPLRCMSSKSYRAFSGCSPCWRALMSVLGSRPLRCIPSNRILGSCLTAYPSHGH